MSSTAQPAVTPGYAEVNGYRLYYELSGAGEPLVIIPGAFMTIALMNDYIPRLAVNHRVVAGVAMQLAIRHSTRVRKVIAASVTFRSDGLHAELRSNLATPDAEQLDGTIFHQSYLDVAADAARWRDLVDKVFELDSHPQAWSADDVSHIASPVMLVAADNDIVRLEHAVEMLHLLGGGVVGDIHGLPASQLAVVPGTSHMGLMDRAAWLVPMIDEFLQR